MGIGGTIERKEEKEINKFPYERKERGERPGDVQIVVYRGREIVDRFSDEFRSFRARFYPGLKGVHGTVDALQALAGVLKRGESEIESLAVMGVDEHVTDFTPRPPLLHEVAQREKVAERLGHLL